MKFIEKPKTALPLVTILTLAATGTEMNQFAVLQNELTKEKIGFGSPLVYPYISYCDPSYTTTVSKDYTGYGIADIIAHALEGYFGEGESVLSDRFVVSIIREMKEAGPSLLNNLHDYELRARVMWASTCALNGLTFYGRKSGDWGVHDLGHILSLLYDLPHGATLSIAFPAWMKYHSDKIADRILWLGKEVFGTTTVTESIEALEKLFLSLHCPIRLQNSNIPISKKVEIISLMLQNKVSGMTHKLNENAVEEIVGLMY
jgi:alcohol dehydrogenase YqhD (iron-dependent ADH family)